MDEMQSFDENEQIEDAPKFDGEADLDADQVGFGQQGAQRNPPIIAGYTNYPTAEEDDEVEFAQELTANEFSQADVNESDTAEVDVKSGFGWFAVVLSIVSFFMMPVILSGAGIVLGFVAKSRGANTLGNTAIIAGAISMIITLFIVPMV
ncbi:hypothetical protein GCM10011351_16960 [Paraliobacillus quinghaiensis]|uniref:DUF4190 domain-containing protein n=1 Tax=Paraliobacillus quinghaiensis TaxID=470815 RepID=A0A917TPJ9_9BACI|nr:hypothetical protein [Paraliobacillus quinghaiensis]GGM31421.1 hypothetical protein GCM10011351_16960 [Paraliobacillus quinghaiensis]